MLDLYHNIKNMRIRLKMTQTELADKLGYADKSMIAKIENGKVDLPQSKIEAFAKALETTPAALMGWIDEQRLSEPIPIVLRDDEQKLLNNYNRLNIYGKEKVNEYVDDLVGNVKYTEEKSLDSEDVG